MNGFSNYHPAVLFAYFLAALLLTMFTAHPVLLALTLLGSVCFFTILHTPRDFLHNLAFYIPMFLLLAVTNPLFSHNGETPLFFLNDNPVTLEAIVYGAAIAVMLIAVVFWFKCLNDVMTSDKFLYLFGKLIPKLSLILSMALRFVPLFKAQIKKIHQTQKTLGLYASKSVADRLLGGFRVLSVLITWSLENAVDTAASMKARGYGLKGRTNFSLFRFRAEDGVLLGVIGLLCAIVFLGLGMGRLDFYYYPYISRLSFDLSAWLAYAAALLLFFLPFAIEIKENLQWKYLRSKI